jgi:chloride channel protein, CIC family
VKPRPLSYIYLLFFSVFIGLAAGTGALVFRLLIELFQGLFWGAGPFPEQAARASRWMKLAIPSGVGLLAGVVIHRFAPEVRGPGVPEVIVSVVSRQSAIRHRVTFFKALVTSLLIGGGASVGREGPIVQIGASVGSSLARLFRMRPELRRAFLAAGAAAGISATFNAPVTGTLFAIEIILLDLDLSHITHIVVASVTASVLSRLFLGDFPAFHTALFVLADHRELLVHFAVGLVGGGAAVAFIRLVGWSDRLFSRLPGPDWYKPGLGGLLLGAMSLRIPSALGVGYDIVNAGVDGELLFGAAAVLILAKMAATSLCIGSGMSGGIFVPSLAVGAALGTAVGIGLDGRIAGLPLDPAHYALTGMGAVVAGTTLAPITAIITIFELTLNEQVILPVMVSSITAMAVVRLMQGHSVYEARLLRQGIDIVRGHDVGILRHLSVEDFMTRDFETLSAAEPLTSIVDRILESNYPHFVVLDTREKPAGFLSFEDLREVMREYETLKNLLVAADIMRREVVTISAGDNLEQAFRRFEEHPFSCLPVTAVADPSRIVGILKKDDLLRAYRDRVLRDGILSAPIR